MKYTSSNSTLVVATSLSFRCHNLTFSPASYSKTEINAEDRKLEEKIDLHPDYLVKRIPKIVRVPINIRAEDAIISQQ